ncbi:hypothetical protein [Paracoccus albus]|uniref:hypothetical protein n=1 Tax=Paracoccus albus TaxID=3017784 RepID=UPI0022F0B91D|nr:hypothetical protein [Paracoccus albus]WBU59755.1 hypothetical protein PAF20_13490 [Paracoccus albus]
MQQQGRQPRTLADHGVCRHPETPATHVTATAATTTTTAQMCGPCGGFAWRNWAHMGGGAFHIANM